MDERPVDTAERSVNAPPKTPRRRSSPEVRAARWTGILFAVLVVAPGLALGWMAIRASRQEEAVIEKQLRTALLSEVVAASERVTALLASLQTELDAAAPTLLPEANARTALQTWTDSSSLVGVPFLFQRDNGTFLWPNESSPSLSPAESEFLKLNLDFFRDRKTVEVYQNVALDYAAKREKKSQPVRDEPRSDVASRDVARGQVEGGEADMAGKDRPGETADDQAGRADADQTARAASDPTVGATDVRAGKAADDVALAEKSRDNETLGDELLEAEVPAPKSAATDASRPPIESKAAARQEALIAFEQSDEVRQQVYKEAEESGKNVVLRPEPATRAAPPSQRKLVPSLFVTESLRFSQILGDESHGWIPRLVDDRVMLLYWKRVEGDRILGCAVDESALRERILSALPTVLTEARILTVLDHTGAPIFAPMQAGDRDWRSPFVSREISELLPRWEMAAYLADPDVISAQVRTRTLTIGLLVTLLVASILTGSLLVTRLLRSELRLAEQKTTFVANVSHELKTPLTSIRLFSEMLRDGKQRDAGKQKQYLDIMVSETERLTRLINNVLDFSRLHREKRPYSMRRIDLVALCRDLVETQAVRLHHGGFVVESAFEVEEAWARIDPEAIEQALLNLLSNAEKYSPVEKWIRVAVDVEGGQAVVSVADHGIGIRVRDAARIFDEFYRADDSLTAGVRGTGLGLTLSRRIVEDHGGTITHRPNEPRGSVFEVRLPLDAEDVGGRAGDGDQNRDGVGVRTGDGDRDE